MISGPIVVVRPAAQAVPAGPGLIAGPAGKSAYQVWLDAGNTGPIGAFLASLVGATGNPGSKGDKGDIGTKGDKGDAGSKGDQGIQGPAGGSGFLVRHTVASGPAAASAPNFLPATSGSLTLAFQNLSSTSPLVLTCAKGFSATGAVDAIASITANPSLTLAASATSYLFYDFDAGTWGSTTLQPIYQFGGTISTTSGQFTFDIQAMVGWVGNGSAAVRANRVFAAEAVTSASAVTSTIAYAYSGAYESAWTAGLPTAVSTVRSHNLGVVPDARKMIAQCTAADSNSGYAVGDTLTSDAGLSAYAGTFSASVPILPGRLNATLLTGGNGYIAVNKSSGAASSLTPANWQWKIAARRGW